MSKLTTVPGGLANLARFVKARSEGVSPAQMAQTLKADRKAKMKAEKARLAQKQARLARLGKQQRTMQACLCCGAALRKTTAAVVLFKLTNGSQGTIAGKLCLLHREGDDWRGVGTIETVTRKGVKLAGARDGRPYYTADISTVENKAKAPKVASKTVKLTKPQAAAIFAYRKAHVEARALKSNPALTMAETPAQIAVLAIAHHAQHGCYHPNSIAIKADGSANKAKLATLVRALARFN